MRRRRSLIFALVTIFIFTISLTFSASAAGYCPVCGRETPATYTNHGTYWSYVCDVCGYNFGGSSGGDSGGGSSSEPTTTQLSTPTGVSAYATGAYSIHVSWNYVSGADYYTIYYRGVHGYGRSTTYDTGNTTSTGTSVNLSVRYSETTYDISVYAESNSSYYTESSAGSTSATTQRAITYVSAPNITLTPTAPDTISVTWSAVSYATGYQLQYSTASNMSSATTVSTSGTSYTITGLQPNTTYYVRSYSNTSGSYYASNGWSSTKNTKTLKIPLDAPAMSSLTISDCNTLVLQFNGVENATSYIIEYSTDSSFSTKSTINI